MRINKVLALSMGLFFTSVQAETLVFSQAGFSIDSLETKPTQSGSKPLQMLLPAENGFSANVNVQIQPYAGTLAQYTELSKSQFKQMGFKLIKLEESGNTARIEYSGLLQGQELHFYAKAVKFGQYVYLATATDRQGTWDKNKEKLISTVNSFKIQ